MQAVYLMYSIQVTARNELLHCVPVKASRRMQGWAQVEGISVAHSGHQKITEAVSERTGG